MELIENCIATGVCSPRALNELDKLITDIENGRKIFKRFPQAATRANRSRGRINVAAALLVRGSQSASGTSSLSIAERYERDKRQQSVQERIIENWARAAGIWHDNLDTIDGKEQIAEGGEAKVFFSGYDINVTKILSTAYFITPQFAADRIILHNTLFPAAFMEVTGFGRDSFGEFQFIVEQPFVKGCHTSLDEIREFMEKSGFKKSSKECGNTYTTPYLYVSDLHDENVLKTPKGNLIVIDADIRLNTPELRRDGVYQVDDEIE